MKQNSDKFVPVLFQGRTLGLYQRCATLKMPHRVLFHFQHWINVISTFNVDPTLECWLAGLLI